MSPRCRRHLTMPQKALLHDPDLVGIAPVSPTRDIRGRKDLDLGSELMVGHKVGLIIAVEIPSDGRRRRLTRNGRVSSEWFNRPDDERYLSLDDLWANVKGRSERSRSRVVQTADIRVEAARDNPERLHLMLPKAHEPVAPTHWAFGQLASIVGAPASYLRQLPAPLAGINLQYGLTNHRAEQVKTFETEDGRTELRAVTGPDYGRIHDHELVEAVQRIAGNGTGDTRWKVPGVLDWSTGVYNPDVEISRDTTTLYASDRDVFLFLVDDHNPIEAGRLPDGSPDLYFRGFYCWNSEVGAKTLGMASFYLRAVCQNRNLWGVEDFQEITIRHSKYAAYHEYTMSIDVSRDSPTWQPPTADAEDIVTEALRDLARWLYRQLEAEYDHLTSDEAIEEGIIVNEYTFTEAGRRFG